MYEGGYARPRFARLLAVSSDLHTRVTTAFLTLAPAAEGFIDWLLLECNAAARSYAYHPLFLPMLVLKISLSQLENSARSVARIVGGLENSMVRYYGTGGVSSSGLDDFEERGIWKDYNKIITKIINGNILVSLSLHHTLREMSKRIFSAALALKSSDTYTDEMIESWRHLGVQLEFFDLNLQATASDIENMKSQLSMQASVVCLSYFIESILLAD